MSSIKPILDEPFIYYAMFVIIMYVRYDDNITGLVCDVGGMYWRNDRPINT